MPKWGRNLMDQKLLQLGSDYYFTLKIYIYISQDSSKKAVEAGDGFTYVGM